MPRLTDDFVDELKGFYGEKPIIFEQLDKPPVVFERDGLLTRIGLDSTQQFLFTRDLVERFRTDPAMFEKLRDYEKLEGEEKEEFTIFMIDEANKFKEEYDKILKETEKLERKEFKTKKFKIGSNTKNSKDGDIVEYEDENIYIPKAHNCLPSCLIKAYGIERKVMTTAMIDLKLIKGSGALGSINYRKLCDKLSVPILPLYKYSDKTNLWKQTNSRIKTKFEDGTKKPKILCVRTVKAGFYHAVLCKTDKVTMSEQDIFGLIKYEKYIRDDQQYRMREYTPKKRSYDLIGFYDLECFLQPERLTIQEINEIQQSIKEKGTIDERATYRAFKCFAAGFTYFNPNEENYLEQCEKNYIDFYGEDSELIMIDFIIENLEKNILLYAHNGGNFDHNFVIHHERLKRIQEYSSKSRTVKIQCQIKETDRLISLVDSYAIIPNSLKSVSKSFCKKYKKLDFEITNLTFDNYMENEVDCKEYLKHDVLSMSEAMITISNIFQNYNVDIFNYYTIGSLAIDLLKKISNVRKIFYCNHDNTNQFFREACHGGRVLPFQKRFNKPGKKLISLDGNSLYPSAMCEMFPVGKFKVLTKKEMGIVKDSLNNQNYEYACIARCKINIPADEPFPVIPKIIKSGKVYDNQTITGCYSSVALQDAIYYNDAEILEIYECAEWSRSMKIFEEFINLFYNLRKSTKEEAAKHAYKILLNSSYGKFGQFIDNSIKFASDSELPKLDISKIKDVKKIEKKETTEYRMTVEKDAKPTLPNYIAAFVLDYSKRIMNRLFSKIKVNEFYYTDTDSAYIDYSAYKERIEEIFPSNNQLCGFKNDYGDGIYIDDAYFLDIKRYLLRFEDYGDYPEKKMLPFGPLEKGQKRHYTTVYKCKFLGLKELSRNTVTNDITGVVTKKKIEEIRNKYNDHAVQEHYIRIEEYHNLVRLFEKLMGLEENNLEESVTVYAEKWLRRSGAVYLSENLPVEIKASFKSKRKLIGNYLLPLSYEGAIDTSRYLITNDELVTETKEEKNQHIFTASEEKPILELFRPYITENPIISGLTESKQSFITNYYLYRNDDQEYEILKKINSVYYYIDEFGTKKTIESVDETNCFPLFSISIDNMNKKLMGAKKIDKPSDILFEFELFKKWFFSRRTADV